MHRIGHPDNPLTKCKKLIPGLYMLCMHGGIAKVKKRIPALSAVELQFQLFAEVPKTAAPLKKYVTDARKIGIEFTAHAPFLFDNNHPGKPYTPLDADWVWVLVPKKYKKDESLGKHAMAARTGRIKDYEHLIDVLGELGIAVLTIHVTEHGVIPMPSEWRTYLSILKHLDARARRVNLTIAIETGGMGEKHMQEIVRKGMHMNFDVPHYFMEMLHCGMSAREANARAVRTFKRFQEHFAILHLSQPTIERDAHMKLFDRRGRLTCIDTILRQVRKGGRPQFVILETQPDKKAVTHIHKILNC